MQHLRLAVKLALSMCAFSALTVGAAELVARDPIARGVVVDAGGKHLGPLFYWNGQAHALVRWSGMAVLVPLTPREGVASGFPYQDTTRLVPSRVRTVDESVFFASTDCTGQAYVYAVQASFFNAIPEGAAHAVFIPFGEQAIGYVGAAEPPAPLIAGSYLSNTNNPPVCKMGPVNIPGVPAAPFDVTATFVPPYTVR